MNLRVSNPRQKNLIPKDESGLEPLLHLTIVKYGVPGIGPAIIFSKPAWRPLPLIWMPIHALFFSDISTVRAIKSNFSISGGILLTSPFNKGGLRGIYLYVPTTY